VNMSTALVVGRARVRTVEPVGDHVLSDGEQVPQVNGLLHLDIEDADAAGREVKIHPELHILVVRGLEHLLLLHLVGQGREGEDQLVVSKAVVEAVQEVETVSLEVLDPDKEGLDQGVVREPGHGQLVSVSLGGEPEQVLHQ
jgi:hypothetical protein